MKNSALKKIGQYGLSVFLFSTLSACSSLWDFNDEPRFAILAQGKNIETRPKMAEVCKGFHVSEKTFNAFVEHAAVTHEETLNERYKALPCFSSGYVYLDEEKFNWVIRAGGVGEFYNENSSFTKICGVACCKKVAGVC
ncbi:hypothetical protein CW745_01130 [Psychromonas sp. psych-6C06]|uniref:hypothetical protein n=1 Tax=Psychromonas sp. psych-6C06 TaxID=2058089 RepID=UPI000C343D8A|nr:hypothetical protein [Psychromonas sp. psych-6C06]PKF63482.1 hypothetical protein CW745_01130 [Psychromonas sp. psych-6C06]